MRATCIKQGCLVLHFADAAEVEEAGAFDADWYSCPRRQSRMEAGCCWQGGCEFNGGHGFERNLLPVRRDPMAHHTLDDEAEVLTPH